MDTTNLIVHRTKNCFIFHWRGLLIISIPIIFSPIMFVKSGNEYRCIWILCVLTLYWVTELIPIFLTSMLPVILLPLLGILDSNKTCIQYLKEPTVTFFGAIIIGLAIQTCNLHRRLALGFIILGGCKPRRLHILIVIITAFISLWIVNSATTAIMCPIISALIEELHNENVFNMYMENEEASEKLLGAKHLSPIACAYYFGIAYGSSIGGCGTLIGSDTNLIFKRKYEAQFSNAIDKITFGKYAAYSFPLVAANLAIMLFGLQLTNMGLLRPDSNEAQEINKSEENASAANNAITQKFYDLGSLTVHEFQICIFSVLILLLLLTRQPLFMTGWADIINAKEINGSMPIMGVIILLFIFPMNYTSFKNCRRNGPYTTKPTPSLISWKFIHVNMSWGVLFLVGGGYAIAMGVNTSGLSQMFENSLKSWKTLSPVLLILLCTLLSISFSAVCLNSAVCAIIIPAFITLANAANIHPLLLILPASIGCSFAFFLPISTPPNAIVASYAGIKSKYLIIAGIIPSMTALITILLNAEIWYALGYPT